MQKDIHQSEYWDNRYKNGETGWDMGAVSPPLAQYIDQINNKNISILIPGCGNAYEAEYLMEKGFTNVTLLDLSNDLVKKLNKKFSKYINDKKLNIIQGDFFKYKGKHDLIIEQTFFCSFSPERRTEYASKAASILPKEGKIAGLLFNCYFDHEGPPYGGNLAEYRTYFSPFFYFHTYEQAYNSIAPRAGNELFVILVRR